MFGSSYFGEGYFGGDPPLPDRVIEAASAVDSVSGIAVYNVSVTETASASDSVNLAGTVSVTFGGFYLAQNQFAGGTAIPTSQTYLVSVSESASALDSPSSTTKYSVTISESGSAVDSPSSTAKYSVTISESSSAVDSPSALVILNGLMIEAGTANETITATISFGVITPYRIPRNNGMNILPIFINS